MLDAATTVKAIPPVHLIMYFIPDNFQDTEK